MVEKFDAVVIGTGFGGTILTLSLVNKFEAENKKSNTNKKVCVLERGEWWISHELNYTNPDKRTTKSNMREFLEDNKRPYHFYPHPDNVKGIIELLSMARSINKIGLYDLRIFDNIAVICANGLGGGSLIYSNVILQPYPNVYKDWPTQSEGKKLENYFDMAKSFLGINRISTNAGLGRNKLEKTKVFQDAGQALIDEGYPNIINKNIEKGYFDVDLSITDIPGGLFDKQPPSPQEIEKLLKQNNDCQRQGRCVLGCIPGARHTFGYKLFEILNSEKSTLDLRELSEVYDIEFSKDDEYKYTISYFKHDPETEEKESIKIITKMLIISAGTLGSNELLMRCKEINHLHLSDMLGKKFFTNCNILGFMTLQNKSIDITRGPINTAHVDFKVNDLYFTIEDTTIPKMVSPAISTLFGLISGTAKNIGGNSWKKLSQDLDLLYKFGFLDLVYHELSLENQIGLFLKAWKDDTIRKLLKDVFRGRNIDKIVLEHLLSFLTTDYTDPFASPEERMSKFFVFSCMGLGEKPGSLKLKPNFEEDTEILNIIDIEWSAKENNEAFKVILDGMKKLAGKIEARGDERVFTPLWKFDDPEKSSTVVLHPIGGCSMGDNIENGVVNSYGQVFMNTYKGSNLEIGKMYPDLYIIDGSILPASTGVNPSLTIAAVAFRAAEKIVGPEFISF